MSQGSCPKCGSPIQAGWKFCTGCGRKVEDIPASGSEASQQTAATRHSETVRADGAESMADPEVVATSVVLEGASLTGSDFYVHEGTKALLFLDGKLAETLDPGRHRVGGFLARLKGRGQARTSCLFVRTHDLDLEFEHNELRTSERIPLTVKTRVTLRIGEPDLFFNNMLAGRQGMTRTDLRVTLFNELRDGLSEALGHASADGLSSDASVKRNLEMKVEEHLRRNLERRGLSLVQFAALAFEQEDLDGVHRTLGDAAVRRRQQQAERDTMDVDVADVELHLERQKVLRDMREAVNSSKMDAIQSEEEMADFLHEIDKKKVIRSEEMEEFKRAYADKKEDREGARTHLLHKLDVERDHELRKIKLDNLSELKRAEIQQELDEQWQRVQSDLRISRARDEERMSARRSKHTQDMAEARDALEIRKLKEAQDLERRRIEQDMTLDADERRQKLREQDLRAQAEMRQAEARAKAEELAAYAGLGADQIAAIQSAESDAAAAALAEKFKAEAEARGESTEKIEAMMQQMLARADEQTRQAHDLAKEAMRQQQQTATGVAQGAAGIRPSGAGEPVEDTGKKELICTHCRFHIDASLNPRNCPNCGQAL